jgi:hypothetical protein
VLEGTTVDMYNKGGFTDVTNFDRSPQGVRSFNCGVLGRDPTARRELFMLAKEWIGRVKVQSTHFGEQALLNLAWFKLYPEMPPDSGTTWNAGVGPGGRFPLAQGIMHVAGDHWRKVAKGKLDYQAKVWNAWPKGVKLFRVTETDFWRSSLPHPWPWLNQADHPRYRPFVRDLREASLTLAGRVDGMVLLDPAEAYVLHPRVLAELDAFWDRAAPRFKDVPYQPTYHLEPGGHRPSRLTRKAQRWKSELRSMLSAGRG